METPVHAPFKERVSIELKKIREMPFKKKMEYIWDYYKVSIIVTVIILFLAGSLINTLFINPPPDTALFVVWSAGYATDEQLDGLKTALEVKIVDEGANESVIVTPFFSLEEDPTMGMANIQRLAAMLAAGEIDLFILNEQLLENYAIMGYLQPIEDVLTGIKAENPEVYKLIEEKIIFGMIETIERSTEERAIGIRVGDSPLFNRIDFYVDELYVGVSVSTRQAENVVSALITLFE